MIHRFSSRVSSLHYQIGCSCDFSRCEGVLDFSDARKHEFKNKKKSYERKITRPSCELERAFHERKQCSFIVCSPHSYFDHCFLWKAIRHFDTTNHGKQSIVWTLLAGAANNHCLAIISCYWPHLDIPAGKKSSSRLDVSLKHNSIHVAQTFFSLFPLSVYSLTWNSILQRYRMLQPFEALFPHVSFCIRFTNSSAFTLSYWKIAIHLIPLTTTYSFNNFWLNQCSQSEVSIHSWKDSSHGPVISVLRFPTASALALPRNIVPGKRFPM